MGITRPMCYNCRTWMDAYIGNSSMHSILATADPKNIRMFFRTVSDISEPGKGAGAHLTIQWDF